MAALYGKPTGTLAKRASSLSLYSRWCSSVGQAPYPVEEPTVFDYVSFLAEDGAPATRAQSLRKALGFAKGIVGLAGVDAVLSSRRVMGGIQASLDRRRERRQRDVLTVPMVQFIEAAVLDDATPLVQKVVAGTIAFCLHGRARVGDVLRGDSEPVLDIVVGKGFVEVGLPRHKTSYKARSKMRLPVVGLSHGLSGKPWAEAWLAARREAGLDASASGVFLPAVLGKFPDAFSDFSATTTDVTIMIRELLVSGGFEQALSGNFGAHSLKPTLLSWCAKHGVAVEIRRKLGGQFQTRGKVDRVVQPR